ncbi:metal-dependent hydrolase [Aurantiacibacter sp. MUD11]|uniref:metal-dependent hydrolase n=1 Tax=Aurantiacibacter sp. MUD11 TaxID=3003265 RepID=UPI002ED5B5A6
MLHARDRRFGRNVQRKKGKDPVAAAWFLALSASFPRGEAMFIEAVKAHRDGTPERLAGEIREFIKQEVNHTREHIAFNRAAVEAGYDVTNVERRVNALADEALDAPRIVTLAITIALEHFTAIIAHLFLTDPDSIVSDGIGDPELWRWHAAEEIEHKGVAFDTWNHATRDWTDRKRYMVRTLVMLKTTARFLRNRVRDSLELMEQDGITGLSARWKLFAYLLGKPGMLRRIFPAWLSYFRPGFHPWDHDDRELIQLHDSAYAAANMEAVPAE